MPRHTPFYFDLDPNSSPSQLAVPTTDFCRRCPLEICRGQNGVFPVGLHSFPAFALPLYLGIRSHAGMHSTSSIALTEAESSADLALARNLFQEYADWLGFSLAYQNFDDELAFLPGKYARPQGRLLLAHLDNVVAGCAALRPLERSVCEMKRLYVRPGFHGRGIGRTLAQRLIEESRTLGYSHVRLDTIADRMPKAIALYRSLGFQEIAAYYAGARPGTLYFELRLDP